MAIPHTCDRWVGGDAARAKANAAELVSQKPDVIIVSIGDPIGQGFVSSLAHPGGNITGFTAFEFATSAKWLELIKEIAPELRSLVQSDPR